MPLSLLSISEVESKVVNYCFFVDTLTPNKQDEDEKRTMDIGKEQTQLFFLRREYTVVYKPNKQDTVVRVICDHAYL